MSVDAGRELRKTHHLDTTEVETSKRKDEDETDRPKGVGAGRELFTPSRGPQPFKETR